MLEPALRFLSPAGPRGRLTVLIFHRVLPRVDEIFPGEVDAARFDTLCGWLRRWFNCVALDEGVARLVAGNLPERALAITFDDGYADNHEIALPILQRHGLTATFFVATGFLNGGRMWNDTVVEALRSTTARTLDLAALELPSVQSVGLGSIGERRAAIATLLGAIKYLNPDRRLSIVQTLATITGQRLPSDLMMRDDQVQGLYAAGMGIGGHTVNHPILSRLADDEASNEIRAGKDRLEALIQAPVTVFAYPNGRPGHDFTARDMGLAREAGFAAAVTTARGAGGRQCDAFQIPRFTPWDRSRLRFALRLAQTLVQADPGAATGAP